MIILASDHRGYELKEEIKNFFITQDIPILDVGTFSEELCDYPDIVKKANTKVITNPDNYGIYICGTGIGMSIAANRNSKIRAALCNDVKTASLARRHNNANVLCLAGDTIRPKKAFLIIKEFLTTSFEGGRYLDRINKIS